MVDQDKAKEQIADELIRLRHQIAELEALEVEHKKVEEELKVAQKYARDIINSSLDMIIAVDKDRKIIEFNKAAQETFGYSEQEVLGKHVQILYDDVEEGSEVSKTVSKEGRTIIEVTNRRKNGETFPCLISSAVLHDTEGRFIGFMGISRDITKQKMAEEELRRYRIHLEELVRERTAELTQTNEDLQQEIVKRKQVEEELAAEKERLAVTLRSIGDGVIATDTQGRIVLINEVAEKLTVWTEEEAVGEFLYKVFHIVNEKTRKPRMNPAEKTLATDQAVPLTNHTILIARDGTERIIANSGAPIHDKMGNVIGVVLVFRDITEKRRIQEELQRGEKLESIGVLAGGIAHDFNNLLTAILGNISLAKMIHGNPEDKVYEKLTEAEKASLRAQDLTQQLLTFSRGGAPILKTSSIVELVKDSAKFALTGSNVRCEFSIPDDIWQAEIDEGQVSQVVNNTVINADQAMPEGGIINICAENTVIGAGSSIPIAPGKYIKISIKDQGLGISEEHLQKIFDPYFTTKQRGNGLGLATSHSIIKSHGGYITAESRLGSGTTFFIYLPASPGEALISEEKPIEEARVGRGKILVMDDEEMVREATCEMLRNIGYGVSAAQDGAEAIEMYRSAKESHYPFNAVIMDLTVPGGMGGKEAIQKLMEIDPEVKAIASSGYSFDPIISELGKCGFNEFLIKPYGIKELSDKVHVVLNEF